MVDKKDDGVIVQKNGWKIVIPIALVIALLPSVLQIFGVSGAQNCDLEKRIEKVETIVATLEKCMTKVETAQAYNLEVQKEIKETLKEMSRKIDRINNN